jgi:hypothetical protein
MPHKTIQMEYIDDFENYHDPENLNEMLFAPLIDDGLTNLRYDENDIEFYKCPKSFENEFDWYFDVELKKIKQSRDLIINTKNNFIKKNINEFKKWFFNYFAGYIINNTALDIMFNWNDEFTNMYMNVSLFYLEKMEDQIEHHKDDDVFDFKCFYKFENLMRAIAITLFEAELFEQIEDDWGIFEDED